MNGWLYGTGRYTKISASAGDGARYGEPGRVSAYMSANHAQCKPVS